MQTILYLIQKEFKQVLRNRAMLPMIFLVPVIQLIVLVNAATFDIKNIRFAVVDEDRSTLSQKLVGQFIHSSFFVFDGYAPNVKAGEELLKRGTTDLLIVIRANNGRQLVQTGNTTFQVLADAVNGMKAGVAVAYINSILADFNQEIAPDYVSVNARAGGMSLLPVPRFWYNPGLQYKNFMVPAVLAILVTMIAMFLSGMNLVREKEIGTIEQINVTPIHKYQFIAGKLIPFWIIALIELSVGLIIGKLLFHIPFEGSLALLYFSTGVYLLVVLGFGLLVSTLVNTQQQSMFISWFFLMVFVMMSGIFTPVENMPDWAQWLNYLNPVYYFMRIIRMIILKGSIMADILPELIALGAYAIVILGLATWRYRKTA